MIAPKFCTCHDSCAVVPCAKICSVPMITYMGCHKEYQVFTDPWSFIDIRSTHRFINNSSHYTDANATAIEYTWICHITKALDRDMKLISTTLSVFIFMNRVRFDDSTYSLRFHSNITLMSAWFGRQQGSTGSTTGLMQTSRGGGCLANFFRYVIFPSFQFCQNTH